MLTFLAALFRRHSTLLLVAAMLIDIAIGNYVIAMSGGISNPFSTLLLIYVVLAVLLLEWLPSLVVLAASMLAQVAQLWAHQWLNLTLDQHHGMGPEFVAHAQGMVISFVIAALIIWASSLWLKTRWQQSRHLLQKLRERQLRDEQLLTIGSAAAQLTHDLATPVQTLQLLHEEFREQAPHLDWSLADHELSRISHSLKQWRQASDDVRQRRRHQFKTSDFINQINRLLRVITPESNISWKISDDTQNQPLVCDRTLIPAIANLINNAIEASAKPGIDITVCTEKSTVHWTIINSVDPAQPIAKNLGIAIQASTKGSGVAAVISHATIERHGGQVWWRCANDLAYTEIFLPLGTSTPREYPHDD